MSDLSFLAKKRYTTKAFDPTKTIPADKIADIKTLLQFSPSSTNSQPWHFVLAGTAEGKNRSWRLLQQILKGCDIGCVDLRRNNRLV